MGHTNLRQQLKDAFEVLASLLGAHRISTSKSRLWVLMYHRILPFDDPRFALEEPGMVVTPASFHRHLQILKELFEILPLSEWLERRQAGKPLPLRACAITFDDGWLDNYEFALPILRQEGVPATLFAVSGMIGTSLQFWPNRLARILSQPQCDEYLDWLPGYSHPRPPQNREEIAKLISRCKELGDVDICKHLDATEARLRLSKVDQPALMNWDQLKAMHKSDVEIGSHTSHHHRLLTTLPPEIVTTEILQSKKIIEERLEETVKLFCYPNGDVSAKASELVKKHYLGAVTTHRGINDVDAPAHELLRIGIHEDIGNTKTRFQARLSGWR